VAQTQRDPGAECLVRGVRGLAFCEMNENWNVSISVILQTAYTYFLKVLHFDLEWFCWSLQCDKKWGSKAWKPRSSKSWVGLGPSSPSLIEVNAYEFTRAMALPYCTSSNDLEWTSRSLLRLCEIRQVIYKFTQGHWYWRRSIGHIIQHGRS